jgi:hypothetical protein
VTGRGQRATGRGGGLAARRWAVAGWRCEGGGLGVAVRRWAVGGWRREGVKARCSVQWWRGAPAWLLRVRTLIGAVGCGHFLLGYLAANFRGLFVH